MPATTGMYIAGIVMMDEPETVGITTFAANGEVLVTFNARSRTGESGGAPVEQIILGLSAQQAVQLIEKLQVHGDACMRAIASGKGGAPFKESKR